MFQPVSGSISTQSAVGESHFLEILLVVTDTHTPTTMLTKQFGEDFSPILQGFEQENAEFAPAFCRFVSSNS